MDARDWVGLIVVQRAFMGMVFMVVAVRLVLWSRDELTIRAAKGKNGMQAEILMGQIRSGWRKVLRLGLLTIPSWLQLWAVAHPQNVIGVRNVIINLFFTVLMLVDVFGLIQQWKERSRLLWLARNYRHVEEREDRDGAA